MYALAVIFRYVSLAVKFTQCDSEERGMMRVMRTCNNIYLACNDFSKHKTHTSHYNIFYWPLGSRGTYDQQFTVTLLNIIGAQSMS
jgi:hypothetical protein